VQGKGRQSIASKETQSKEAKMSYHCADPSRHRHILPIERSGQRQPLYREASVARECKLKKCCQGSKEAKPGKGKQRSMERELGLNSHGECVTSQ
jgi:hypothetical protein